MWYYGSEGHVKLIYLFFLSTSRRRKVKQKLILPLTRNALYSVVFRPPLPQSSLCADVFKVTNRRRTNRGQYFKSKTTGFSAPTPGRSRGDKLAPRGDARADGSRQLFLCAPNSGGPRHTHVYIIA